MITIPTNDVRVYDLVPGYKFRVRFTNDINNGFRVEIQEDVEHNLEFNKNARFTFDNFEKYLFGTSTIVDNMRNAFVNQYILDIVIYNQEILRNTPQEGFGEACIVVAIENESGRLNPELYEKFCEEYNLPGLKPIHVGAVPAEPDAKQTLLSKSQLSDNGRAYGLVFRGVKEDGYPIEVTMLADREDFVDAPNSMEHQRLLEEYVAMKATSEFVMEAISGKTTLSNSTRVYNCIINAIETDPEYQNYRNMILEWTDEKWLQENLRPTVRRGFRRIYQALKNAGK